MKRLSLILLSSLIFTVIFGEGNSSIVQSSGLNSSKVDRANKPVLNYLLRNSALLEKLSEDLWLSKEQLQEIRGIVEFEKESLRLLYQESNIFVHNRGLTVEEKRRNVRDMGYNETIKKILVVSMEKARYILNNKQYREFQKWITKRWEEEINVHFGEWEEKSDLSYTVYATQYYGDTDYEVALPDKYLKFANRDWQHYPGYEGSDYSVDLEREGSTVNSVLVWEVGPWNEDDNYWNPSPPTDHPRPRRLFTDLDQGMPEAQAAYFNNYNGGEDQFGRIVTNPAGIDLTPDVAADLGLDPLENDWITVTYAWEVGIEEIYNQETSLPRAYFLFQNHPNPFNPITEIKYNLPTDCRVKLTIYNLLGQRAAILVDERQQAGYRSVHWDASSFASGIYFYRISAGDFVETRKMILLR